MKVFSVRNKIILVAIGIVLIFAPFVFYYFPNKQKVLIAEHYESEVFNIATTVALGVNIALKEQNFEGVEMAMNHAKIDDRLTFVAMVQLDSTYEGEKLSVEKTIFTVFPEELETSLDVNIETSDSIIVSSASINTDMLTGEVVVGFSTKTIKESIGELNYQSFIGSLILSLIGILFGIWLARSISKPILRLKKATHRVAEGNLDEVVDVKSKDEIGELAESFNSMVTQLNKSERELKHQKALVEEKNQGIIDSINYAKKIQEAILPSKSGVNGRFEDCAVLYMPKDIVSGDFYWMEKIENRTLISVADCTGHGVPGAFVSLVSANALNSCVREHNLTEPALILNQTDTIIRDHFDHDHDEKEMRDGMDLSLCSFIKGEKDIEYAGALNPLWIISSKTPKDNGKDIEISVEGESANLFEIKGDKQPIGRYIEQRPFTNHKVELNYGDVIYLFTDGFADQFGGVKGKKFKYKTFKQLLLKSWDKPLEEQNAILKKEITKWMGDIEQVDDICIIGIRI